MNDEFEPITPEEQALREQQADLARRVRREVLRIERGEADEELRAEREQVEQEQAEEQARERQAQRRRSNIVWQFISGLILTREGVTRYYPYMLAIAFMFFVSIFTMFTALRLDMRYARLEREVQLLRERSIHLQEQRYRQTTYSAIVEALAERGIDLRNPQTPDRIIEN